MCLLNKYLWYNINHYIIQSRHIIRLYFICVQLLLQQLTVAELKNVLKRFGHRVGGNKSVLRSRVTRLLQLEGSSKVGSVIQQFPAISQKIDTLNRITRTVRSSDNRKSACQCTVKFKETTFYTKIDTLVKPTLLGRSYA